MSDKVESQHLQNLKLLWIVFLLSPVLLLLMAWFLVASLGAADSASPTPSDPIVLLFGFLAVLFFLAGQRILRLLPRGSNSPDPQRSLPSFVIRWALFEVVATLGLVLAVIKGSFVLALPFFGLSLIGIVFSMPSLDKPS